MEASPFPHHGPLEPAQVGGRDDLLADLVERVTERRVTAVLGPRRYGKTSLLRKVASDLEAAGVAVIWLDLYELSSMADLALRLDDALTTPTGPLRREVDRIAASLEVNLGVVRTTFSRPQRPDTSAVVHGLLEVLVAAARRHPTLLVVDEFSGIAKVKGAAGLLRTKLQHHFQQMGILFAGSEPSTMEALFSHGEQPFYGQADLVHIPPLDRMAVTDTVTNGFTTTGRDPGDLPTRLWSFCAGHPRRTMQGADLAWRRTRPGDDWSDRVWQLALDDLRSATSDVNEALFSGLGRSEQSVLRALANGGSVWGRAAELLALNPTPARNALQHLRDAGHVVTEGSTHTPVDPILADWIRSRLPL